MGERELKCPVCGGTEFKQDKVVLAKYGVFRVSDCKVKAMICEQCKHIMLFEEGNTFFLGVD